MTHSPEFAFWIIALSLVVMSRTLFLAVMVLGYLRSYFGRDHAPRRPVTLRKNLHLTVVHEFARVLTHDRQRSDKHGRGKTVTY